MTGIISATLDASRWCSCMNWIISSPSLNRLLQSRFPMLRTCRQSSADRRELAGRWLLQGRLGMRRQQLSRVSGNQSAAASVMPQVWLGMVRGRSEATGCVMPQVYSWCQQERE